MHKIAKAEKVFTKYKGMMKTSELYHEGIYYQAIQDLIKEELIEKVRYGYYQWVDSAGYSEIETVARLFPDAVLCLNSALFYYRYSDRIPIAWHLFVSKDSNKSRFSATELNLKPYYVEPALLELGLTEGIIDATTVRITDKERTICDCLKYANKMDREIFNKAIQNYILDPQKNIPHLMSYAKMLRVTRKVENIIGVWL